MAQSNYPLDGSVRHHFPSFNVKPGERSPEECRKISHWRGAKGDCVFCGLPLAEDGSELVTSPSTD